jgi:hypothetical protein
VGPKSGKAKGPTPAISRLDVGYDHLVDEPESENVSECDELGSGRPSWVRKIGSKLDLIDFLTETQCLLKRST